MKINRNFLLIIFLHIPLVLLATSANATSTAPSTVNYQIGSNTALSIIWNVTVPTGISAPELVVSSQGDFTNNISGSIILGSKNTSIQKLTSVGTNVAISENLTIPSTVITQATVSGLSSIFYTRSFNLPSAPTAETATLQIILITPPTTPTTGNTTPIINSQRILKITRESLRFGDGKTVIQTRSGKSLYAVATLNYNGTGLLDAFWEYASPESTRGTPIFIRLNTVRRYLAAGGRVILRSPRLPTVGSGQYFVRLQIVPNRSNPNGVEFTNKLPDGLPILRYNIKPSNKNRLTAIKLSTPLDNTFLKKNTQFSWEAVKKATAYQLELYLPDLPLNLNSDNNQPVVDGSFIENKQPASGVLIPASKTTLLLSSLSKENLQHGKTYYWRIIAIGAEGLIISASQTRKIKIP